MEVREDFAERVSAIAESTPRNAIENLLLGLMPRVPVTARRLATDSAGRAVVPAPEPEAQPRGFFKLTRAPRTRRVRGRDYTVLDSTAHRNHRAGTWTHAMVRCAVLCKNTEEATATLRSTWPEYAERTIDFNWLAKVGYIVF